MTTPASYDPRDAPARLAGARWNPGDGGTISRIGRGADGAITYAEGVAWKALVDAVTDINKIGSIPLEFLTELWDALIPNDAAKDPLGCYLYLMHMAQAANKRTSANFLQRVFGIQTVMPF